MSQQRQEEGNPAVPDDFESLFESIGSSFWEAIERLPLATLHPLGQGSGQGPNSIVSSLGGPDGRADLMLVQSIKRTNLRKVIIRSIIKCRTNEGTLAVSRAIGSSITSNRHSGASSFVAVVPHQCGRPHVHVWHDCNPIQGMCRCRLFQPYRNGEDENDGVLATRKTVPGYRPLRSKPTEEARKDADPYFERLLK